jgi:hypothetical protein
MSTTPPKRDRLLIALSGLAVLSLLCTLVLLYYAYPLLPFASPQPQTVPTEQTAADLGAKLAALPCDRPLLVIGGGIFPIAEVGGQAGTGWLDGPPGIAYRLEASGAQATYVLSYGGEHALGIEAIDEGDGVLLREADCTQRPLGVVAVRRMDLGSPGGQDSAGVVLFVLEDPALAAQATLPGVREELAQAEATQAATALPTSQVATVTAASGATTSPMPQAGSATQPPPASPTPLATNIAPAAATQTNPPAASPLPTNTPSLSPTQPPAATATLAPTHTPGPTSTFVPIPPNRGDINAEVRFVGKQVSPGTIVVTVSIYNYGDSPFTTYMADALLIPPSQEEILPWTSDPVLPFQLGSRQTQVFHFTFRNPGGSEIVFQIYEVVEFDLDDF